MARLNSLLAPGAAPVVGRMFEAGAVFADEAPAPLRLHLPPQARPVLPFIGAIEAYSPRASITVGRRLALEHDLFLADHDFVHAPGVKPLAECFPVMPMTVSLEVMAETAACLAPGYGLVGFEQVVARRWIAVENAGALALRIEASVLAVDASADQARIAVRIFTQGEKSPAIEATVCFATRHQPARPSLASLTDGTAHDAAEMYGGRHLFHGPRFQTMNGQILVAAEGASARLLARGAGDWFADQKRPQLLTDGALLDAVGQLIAVWAMQHGRAAFPIGLDRLDFHGPTPEPGARLPIRLRVAGTQLKMAGAEVEIGDGKGGVWAHIRGWKSWLFEWSPRLVEFQRQPARVLLSEALELPAAPAASRCRQVGPEILKNFDLSLLARHYLHASEWPAFLAHADRPQRQREWLMGRIAAKDAARAWSGQADLHPATFAVVNIAAGRPTLAHWPLGETAPCISIAHAGGRALGVAAQHAVGIDIEEIAPRDGDFVAAVCTKGEQALLAAAPDHERAAWITRLWCAKEAFGKRLGTGAVYGPRQFEAAALESDFSLPMHCTASGVTSRVFTLREGGWIIALDHGESAT